MAKKYSSTLGGLNNINYSPNECLETYPFPKNISRTDEAQLNEKGVTYHSYRKNVMHNLNLGLTKTYNLFHSSAIATHSQNGKDKQVAALQKHLENTPITISLNEAIQDIIKLRELHVQLDGAVLDAYGWNDIELRHDFYEVDYLPENDRIRYTINPDSRKEVLKRLLELNHKIHAEEVEMGLWEKKGSKKGAAK